MGGEISLQPAPPGFDYLSITSYWTDSLRVIFGTTREIDIVRQSIVEHWFKGIQQEVIRFGYAYEFKLKGNPFTTMTNKQEAIACRKMVSSILQRLYNAGWELVASSDLTRECDHLTWFLRRNPNLVSTPYPFLCIGLSRQDSLHIVNASTAMHEVIKNSIARVWPKGIQEEQLEGDTLIIKLYGYPWHPDGEDTVHSKLVMQSLINDLHLQQYVMYTNSNIKSDADSLFFRYEPSVIPGEMTGNFGISLNMTDRLRMIGATADLVDAVRQVIQTFWGQGIQAEREYAGSWEFKLKGTPWWADGAEAVSSRYLILRIFEMFITRGWIISKSLDMTKKESDKSTLIFQRCPPMQAHVFCLSFNDVDKIRVINAPDDVIQTCAHIINTRWARGVKLQSVYAGSQEFKLNGYPWCDSRYSHEGVHARALLCFILQALVAKHWRLITSADVSAKYVHQDKGPDYPIDVHSWYFMYDSTLAALAPPPMGFAPPLLAPPSYESVGKY